MGNTQDDVNEWPLALPRLNEDQSIELDADEDDLDDDDAESWDRDYAERRAEAAVERAEQCAYGDWR